jgi:hypothetical protein
MRGRLRMTNHRSRRHCEERMRRSNPGRVKPSSYDCPAGLLRWRSQRQAVLAARLSAPELCRAIPDVSSSPGEDPVIHADGSEAGKRPVKGAQDQNQVVVRSRGRIRTRWRMIPLIQQKKLQSLAVDDLNRAFSATACPALSNRLSSDDQLVARGRGSSAALRVRDRAGAFGSRVVPSEFSPLRFRPRALPVRRRTPISTTCEWPLRHSPKIAGFA